MNIDKKIIKKAQNTAEILSGLFAFGICVKACYGVYQQRKEQHEFDKRTLATLVGKKIVEDAGKRHVVFWLSTDNDLRTAEGFCNMPDAKQKKALEIYNMTNGTIKTLAEWKHVAFPHKVHYSR